MVEFKSKEEKMIRKLIDKAKKTELLIIVSIITTLLLCPLTIIFRYGIFKELPKYTGLFCCILDWLLLIKYKMYKRPDVVLIFLIIVWSSITSLYTGAGILDAFGNVVLRNWYIALLFYQVPCVLGKEKKERYITTVLTVETLSLFSVISFSMYYSIRLLLDENFEKIKHAKGFVAGRLSTFGNANSAGPACMALIFLSVIALYRIKYYKRKMPVYVLMSISCFVGIVALSLTRCRGAMIATAFGLSAFFFVVLTQKYKRKMAGTFFLSIPVFCVILCVLFLPRVAFEKVMPERTQEDLEVYEVTYALNTLTDRTLVWETCFKMLSEKPERFIYGMTCVDGSGQVMRDIYEGRPELVLGSTHNTILQQLLFFGIFGVLTSISLVMIWTVKGLRVLFSGEENDSKPFYAFSFGIMIFGFVESIAFPYSILCPCCLSLFLFEGYAMSEFNGKKRKFLGPVFAVALVLIAGGLSAFFYSKEKEKQDLKYSSIEAKEQEPTDYVRLNNKVTLEMLVSGYWTDKKEDASKVLLDFGEIERVNDKNRRMIVSGDAEFSLEDVGTEFYYKTAVSLIKDTSFEVTEPEKYLLNNVETDAAYWEGLAENQNLEALTQRINTTFGFSVVRSTLKRYPTDDKVYSEGDSLYFDQMVQSDIQPFMPVAVLHESADGEWYYVIAYGYGGWIKKADVALCRTREEWIERQNPEDFLVVTGREIKLFDNPYCEELSGITIPMGTVLPIANIGEVSKIVQERAGFGNYVTKLFYRGEDGYLVDEYVLIPASEDVSLGYLPYTQEEVAKLMFKYLGVAYGWAGDNDSVDCSLYVRQVYACFGFELPRATTPQAYLYCDNNYDVSKYTMERKEEILETAPIGTMMYFPGHIMMYLGMVEGEPYCISSVGNYSTAELSAGEIVTANTVIVTNMIDTTRATGKSWIDSVERIVIP